MKGKFWRKALAAALALFIVSGSTPIQPLSQVFEDIAITASAESTITPVTPQLDSDGFYRIGSAAELYGFAELVNNGNATANGKLIADIVVNKNVLNANGEANTGDFVQWTPIGNAYYFEDKVYSGTFDGQGHTVSGLYVSGSGYYVGFIGEVSGTAVVRNLGVVDSYFSSSGNHLGSIVGRVFGNSSVTLANVYSTSTVKGVNWIGGLVGGSGNGSVTIINSYFAGKTSADYDYGTHHDDLVSGNFNMPTSGTFNVVNSFVLGTSQYGTQATASQFTDGTVAAALHYYQDALADGSMFGLSDGKTGFSGTIDGVSVTTADITLHTFDGNTTAYSSKYVVGNTTPLPVNVEREGYTFLGWYDNADLEGDAVTSISSSETGDKEYWAKFERSHAVSFVLGGGTIRSGEIDHYIEGETTALPTVVLKEGASFEGWYTTENFTGDRYYSIPATATEDMTFYAKWGEAKTIFYLVQGASPEPVNVLYEGENVVYLDKTTMDRYYVNDEGVGHWGGFSGSVNVPYTGGESTFGIGGRPFNIAQSGFYVFTLTDKGEGNWFVSVLYPLENYCTVSDIPDQTYTGSAIEPSIDIETTLTLGTDYEVTYSDNTNAGTAKATITGKGNYGGTIVKTFAINKATATATVTKSENLTYNKNAQDLITAGSAANGTIKYAVGDSAPTNDSDWQITIPQKINADTYKVWYKVFATDTANYNDSTPASVEVEIKKASPLKTPPSSKNPTRYSSAVQLINAGTVEDGCTIEYSLGTNTAPGETWVTDATKITENKSGTFYVWYKVTGTANYENITETRIPVTVTQYTAPTPTYYSQSWTLTMDSYEYDGTAHTPTINGKAYTYSSTQVQYTYYNADTNEELDGAPSAIGNYKVKVYADGGSNYYSRTQTATYSIANPIDENDMAKVDAFKENDTVPVSDGKIFAGWFTDETCTTAYTEDTGKAYAKFIDENVLTVKAQISSGTTASSASTSIRFITSVDSLKYQNVGFKITCNGKSIDRKMTKVYTAINAGGAKVKPTVFSKDSRYMEAYTLNNITKDDYDKAFTVTPYYTTQDGTIVEGATNTFTIANMIK